MHVNEHFKDIQATLSQSKNPREIWLEQTLGGCAHLEHIFGSVIVLEKTFEPIVYKA